MIKKYKKTFFKSILAGLMISLGCAAYLSIDNKYIGSMLFTIGLYTIYSLDFYLFTGKIGYFFNDKDINKILIIWFGNLIGVTISAYMFLSTRIIGTTTLLEKASYYSNIKLEDGYFSIFVLAIYCGIMMFLAADSFKKSQHTHNSIGGYIGLFLCVMIFILLGFEHSIANMFYFTISASWSISTILPLLIVTLGNAVGALLIPSFNLLMQSESIKLLCEKK